MMPDILSSCSLNSQQPPNLNKRNNKITHDSFGNVVEKTNNNKLLEHVVEKGINIKNDIEDQNRDIEKANQVITEVKIDKSRPISSINIVGTPW
jgi:hypothetical protein